MKNVTGTNADIIPKTESDKRFILIMFIASIWAGTLVAAFLIWWYYPLQVCITDAQGAITCGEVIKDLGSLVATVAGLSAIFTGMISFAIERYFKAVEDENANNNNTSTVPNKP